MCFFFVGTRLKILLGILSRCLACLEQPDCGDSSTSKALKEVMMMMTRMIVLWVMTKVMMYF